MKARLLFAAISVALLSVSFACSHHDHSTAAEGNGDGAGVKAAHGASCQAMQETIPGGESPGTPGVSGAPRWGIPTSAAPVVRVRRSWSKLSAEEKKRVVDAFVALKKTTVGSGAPGAERAAYTSFCSSYTGNLYDYYVELHHAAFFNMNTPAMSHVQMAHMGPQLLPWHRYLLLRLEADLRQVTGDPEFTLPYWDWEDCQGETADGVATCPEIFTTETLGSAGSCDQDDQVKGYLVDQGFITHLSPAANLQTIFSISSLSCTDKALERNVGCSRVAPKPPSAQDVAAIYERKVYDAAPYDSCITDETVSFRQYLEGFTRTDVNPTCVSGGCQMHGQGHIYIGGDMAGAGSPNDPIFFLHHANVDRLWAMWQDHHRKDAAGARDYGNPGFPALWRGPLFNFEQIRAEEMFDFRALGFRYDTNPES